MIKLLLTSLGVAVGSLALSLTVGAGVASADPDLGPAVNSTCTYSQLVAALNAQNPMFASALNSSPEQQDALRRFLASPPETRARWAQEIASAPENKPYLPLIRQAFNTCSSF